MFLSIAGWITSSLSLSDGLNNLNAVGTRPVTVTNIQTYDGLYSCMCVIQISNWTSEFMVANLLFPGTLMV